MLDGRLGVRDAPDAKGKWSEQRERQNSLDREESQDDLAPDLFAAPQGGRMGRRARRMGLAGDESAAAKAAPELAGRRSGTHVLAKLGLVRCVGDVAVGAAPVPTPIHLLPPPTTLPQRTH